MLWLNCHEPTGLSVEEKMEENDEAGREYPQGAIESEYKGKPTLCLNPDEKFPFSFGLGKAQLILEHLEDIEAFVVKHTEE
jgi:hypothetical protein